MDIYGHVKKKIAEIKLFDLDQPIFLTLERHYLHLPIEKKLLIGITSDAVIPIN